MAVEVAVFADGGSVLFEKTPRLRELLPKHMTYTIEVIVRTQGEPAHVLVGEIYRTSASECLPYNTSCPRNNVRGSSSAKISLLSVDEENDFCMKVEPPAWLHVSSVPSQSSGSSSSS